MGSRTAIWIDFFHFDLLFNLLERTAVFDIFASIAEFTGFDNPPVEALLVHLVKLTEKS